MFKTKSIYQLTAFYICLCCSFGSVATPSINFEDAKTLMNNAYVSIENKNAKIGVLKDLLANIEDLNSRANYCMEIEKKQLAAIAALEADSGILDPINKNSEDIIYIKNKQKIHYERASKCRLLAFKTQDLAAQLSEAISDANKSNPNGSTLNDKITVLINSKQNAVLTFGLLILFISLIFASRYIISREKTLKGIYLKKYDKYHEIKLLRLSLYSLVICLLIVFIFQLWDISSVAAEKTIDFIIHGTTFYGSQIIPIRLLIALLAFSIIQIVGKYFAVRISEQPKFEDEAKTQIVISTLMTYIVFTFALLSALVISGVDLTSLAIIAGALSVGIGLGLQGLVNNFVSGLVLLIEKPIRPGDRVKVNGVEGFIIEIGTRSTRVITLLKESVIIPNSELVNNQITNYVFNDTVSRLICKLCVAYDSDLELIKATLLDIAEKHPDISNDIFNKPFIALKDFGQSGINIDFGCVVNDVNRQYMISSEIHFMIIEAFRKNNIVLSYPQLDVHII